MDLRLEIIGLGLLFTTIGADAQVLNGSLYGIDFGATQSSVGQTLREHCGELRSVVAEAPVIPVATKRESRLICRPFTGSDGNKVERLVLVFADEALVMVEASAGAVTSLLPNAGDLAVSFAGFDVYPHTMTVARAAEDVLWSMTPEAAHAHVFLGSSLISDSGPGWNPSARRPRELEFGASLATVKPRLEEVCRMIQIKEIVQPWLPSQPKRQTQIDCFGYDFAGFPRKIEAVFGDGKLELAWILTGKAEEDRVRQALVEAYGQVEVRGDDYEVFAGGSVALRKDKPEVLMLSETQVPLYQEQLNKKSVERRSSHSR